MYWTDKTEFSKWLPEKVETRIRTYQYACMNCGLVQSYLDLSE
jgi:hypothetical protein